MRKALPEVNEFVCKQTGFIDNTCFHISFSRKMSEKEKLPSVVELNVGGRHFTTTLLTLTKCKGTMLAAMFSGNYDVKQDKTGRYFIDTDGDSFVYVLNYLRYGELPPADVADIVYREAVYFGLTGLVEQLERYPSILSKIQREAYRTQFPGYQELISSIVDIVADSNRKLIDTVTDILISLHCKDKKHKFSTFDKNHKCFYLPRNQVTPVLADVFLGPWSIQIAEKEVMNCIAFDLKQKGFTISHDSVGQCNYKCNKPADFPGRQMIESCIHSLYKVTFHWWHT